MHDKATKLRIKFNRMRRAARPNAPKPGFLTISRKQREPGVPVTNFMQNWINALATDGETYEVGEIYLISNSDVTEPTSDGLISVDVSFDYATYNAQTA
jgi:hypothetical protein